MKRPVAHTFPCGLSQISVVVLSMLFHGTASADDGGGASSSTLLAEVEFDSQFLQDSTGRRVDVSRFSKQNSAIPGHYRVEVVVNQNGVGRTDITLRQLGNDRLNVKTCFDRELLERIGVDITKLSPEAEGKLQAGGDLCTTLSDLVKDATAEFDNNEQRLDITVPQIAMQRDARGYVDPKYWDEGVTAARLQYSASHYRTESQGQSLAHTYVGLDAGLNIGPWRIQHNGNLNQDSRFGARYQAVSTKVQRSIVPIKSQLTLGDTFTDGALFDSVGIRGAQVATDDRMYPESQRGYAPTVRGIANSNARVVVRQNGNIIYETTVAPGAFEINDLYPTGYGGDLLLSVQEADGTVRVSRVPYAPAVNALRPGITRYGVALGQYRNTAINDKPLMLQATVQHGISNLLTGYGGILLSKGYASALVGAALNTSIGAFGADITHSTARLQHQPSRSGQSVRLSFSKLVEPTNTNIAVAAFRYSSSGYLSLTDAVTLNDLGSLRRRFMGPRVQRSRLQLTLNQTLPPGYGSVYITGSAQDYWNSNGSDTQFQLGYNNTWKQFNYGISATRQYNVFNRRWDTQVLFTLSVPLGKSPGAPHSTTNLQRASNGSLSAQESVTGALGKDNEFTYGLDAGYSGGAGTSQTKSLGAHGAYAAPAATISGNVSKSSAYTQFSAGVSGGIVAYRGGVVFTPTMGDTMAIVEADNAAGAKVGNSTGVRLDRRGRAVVTNLTPFSVNSVEVDPTGLPINVEFASTTQRVIPTQGAIVPVTFSTVNKGRAALIRTTTTDGKPLPFGAEVLNDAGQNIGSVAQAGRLIVHGLRADTGTLTVRTGDKPGESCVLTYVLPDAANASKAPFEIVDSVCR